MPNMEGYQEYVEVEIKYEDELDDEDESFGSSFSEEDEVGQKYLEKSEISVQPTEVNEEEADAIQEDVNEEIHENADVTEDTENVIEEAECVTEGIEKVYECKFCVLMFRTKNDQEFHQKAHLTNPKLFSNPNDWKCKFCGNGFGSKLIMETHINHVHEQSFIEGDEVGKKCFKKSEISVEPTEVNKEKADDVQENDNEEIHESTEDVTEDTENVIEEAECVTEGTENAADEYFGGFAEEENQTKTKKLTCNRCGKVFSTKSSLSSHRFTCMKEYLYACELCEKKFQDASNLKRHMKMHSDKLFHCKICNQNFSRKCDLTVHNGSYHPGIKTYKCKFCVLMFRTGDDRQFHQLTHFNSQKRSNDPNKWKCKVCDRGFRTKLIRKFHVRDVHGGQKSYRCKECSQQFRELHTLQV